MERPATGWFFADAPPSGAFVPKNTRARVCFFALLGRLFKGQALCFSHGHAGCAGAACYLGFVPPSPKAGYYLSQGEGFKKTQEMGDAFYAAIQARPPKQEFLISAPVIGIDEHAEVEVINLWVNPRRLAALVTLSNYASRNNDNVSLPFASGCQSIWTLPFKEQSAAAPKAIVGCMDPAMREFMPDDVLSFSMSAAHFVNMVGNIPGSFLDTQRPE